jgi:hypothetical protein
MRGRPEELRWGPGIGADESVGAGTSCSAMLIAEALRGYADN